MNKEVQKMQEIAGILGLGRKKEDNPLAPPRMGTSKVWAIGLSNDLNKPPTHFVDRNELKAFMAGETVPGYDAEMVDAGPAAEIEANAGNYKYVVLYMDK